MREVDPLRHCWLQWVRALQLGWARGRAPRLEQAGGQVVWLGQALEVAGWGIAYLGSCHLGGIVTCKVALGKMSREKHRTVV